MEKREPSAVINAYLEDQVTIVVKLTAPLTLPIAASTVTVTDATTGKRIRVLAVNLPQATALALVDQEPSSPEAIH